METSFVLRACRGRPLFDHGRAAALVLLALLVSLGGRIESAFSVPLTPPPGVTGKEYSHFFDEDATGLFDSEQAIFWDGIGGAVDSFDYTPPALGGAGPVRVPPLLLVEDEPETDALANSNDQFFGTLRGNITGLIFSTDGDG